MRAPIAQVEGIAAALPLDNIDTDQIIPARFLRKPRDAAYPRWLFHDLRFAPDGRPEPGFVLNRAPFDRAAILVAGRNFGVGSSREAAVYALLAFGIRAVVAESFGDIFFGNALKNGLLPVRLDAAACAAWRASCDGRGARVDLAALLATDPDGRVAAFTLPGFAREMLLAGLDEIGLTLRHLPAIEAFEAHGRA
jgi:3-isopropylmalate/(R)-2-methylmalate dehydratase small subunit